MTFRTEAIQTIGRIVRARSWCIDNKIGNKLPYQVTAPVINQYKTYKGTWSERGLARFLIKYENNIRRMATGGEQQQQLISKLILEAYYYERISQTSNKPNQRSSISGKAIHRSFAQQQ